MQRKRCPVALMCACPWHESPLEKRATMSPFLPYPHQRKLEELVRNSRDCSSFFKSAWVEYDKATANGNEDAAIAAMEKIINRPNNKLPVAVRANNAEENSVSSDDEAGGGHKDDGDRPSTPTNSSRAGVQAPLSLRQCVQRVGR